MPQNAVFLLTRSIISLVLKLPNKTQKKSKSPRPFREGLKMLGVYVSLFMLSLVILSSCASRQPRQTDNICEIFKERKSWYRAAKKSEEKWGTPKHIQMAIIRQESNFRFDAAPPRTKLFGVIPWKRKSSAYGFAQVKDETWQWYIDKTGNRGADRDNFSDAIDFVGWYSDMTRNILAVSKWDPYSQYLAYHEGHGGYRNKSFQKKAWLIQVAKSVDTRAKQWGAQLRRCENNLDDGWWFF